VPCAYLTESLFASASLLCLRISCAFCLYLTESLFASVCANLCQGWCGAIAMSLLMYADPLLLTISQFGSTLTDYGMQRMHYVHLSPPQTSSFLYSAPQIAGHAQFAGQTRPGGPKLAAKGAVILCWGLGNSTKGTWHGLTSIILEARCLPRL